MTITLARNYSSMKPFGEKLIEEKLHKCQAIITKTFPGELSE
jgi:hypothetical protein